MQTLSRAIRSPDAVGKRIPLPWLGLNRLVRLHTKELVILAGAPGGGKSTLSVNLAMALDVPTLYFAQDSPASVISRMAALATGNETAAMHDAIASAEERVILAARLKDTRPTLVFHRGAVTTERVKDSALALTEWLGHAPPLVILDNLIDMVSPGSNPSETAFYATILPELKQMANELNMCIMVLHHVTRGGGNQHGRGHQPIALNDLLFAGEREARHVWGLYNDGVDTIKLQVLKQQDGPADPDGGMEVALRWYPKLGKLATIGSG